MLFNWLQGQFDSVIYLILSIAPINPPIANLVETSPFGLRSLDGCNWTWQVDDGAWMETAMACDLSGGTFH